jgi:hypothetical protein
VRNLGLELLSGVHEHNGAVGAGDQAVGLLNSIVLGPVLSCSDTAQGADGAETVTPRPSATISLPSQPRQLGAPLWAACK